MARRRTATSESSETAVYVISVAAELAGVHPQTLRVYERKGLLQPERTTGQHAALLRAGHRAAAPHPGAHAGRGREPRGGEDGPASRGAARPHAPRARRAWRRACRSSKPTSRARCAGWRSRPARSSRPATTARSSSCGAKPRRKEAAASRSSSAHRGNDDDGPEQADAQVTGGAAGRAAARRRALALRRSHPSTCCRRCSSEPEGAVYPTLQKLGASPRTLRDGVERADRQAAARVRRAPGRRARAGLRLARAERRPRPRAEGSRRAQGRLRLDRAPAARARAGRRAPSATCCATPARRRTRSCGARRRPRRALACSDQDPESKYQALERFGRDLTELAQRSKLDPVIGRDDEIRRVVHVLSRRTKNNPVLIGEPGHGQDRDRRGARAAHRGRRRPRVAEGQAAHRARPRRDGRRDEVPRRVRGADEGVPQGGRRVGRQGHRLHRRAAHARRSRCGRRRRRRREHAQADARPRRAARDRRDDAGRVPQAHRARPGPRAAVPAGVRRPAVRRGHDRHPARAEGALRGAPRRAHHRLGPRGGGDALAPLHHRTVPARQGDRPRRRGRRAAAHGDRLGSRRRSTRCERRVRSSSRSSAPRCARRRTRRRPSGSRRSRRSSPT